MSGDDSLIRGERYVAELDRERYKWQLEGITRFRVFFVGLVFALLAFSVQFAIKPYAPILLYLQASSWFLLLCTGCLALRDAGGFVSKYTENVFDGLSSRWRIFMWVTFSAALILLGVARVIGL